MIQKQPNSATSQSVPAQPHTQSTNKLDIRIANELQQYSQHYRDQFLRHNYIQKLIKQYVTLYRSVQANIQKESSTTSSAVDTYRTQFIQYIIVECDRLNHWYINQQNQLCTNTHKTLQSLQYALSECYELQQYIQLNTEVLIKLIQVYDNYTKTDVCHTIETYLQTLAIYKHQQLDDYIQSLQHQLHQYNNNIHTVHTVVAAVDNSDMNVNSPIEDDIHILQDTNVIADVSLAQQKSILQQYNDSYTDQFDQFDPADPVCTPRSTQLKQRGFSCHQCKSTKSTHLLLFCNYTSEPTKEHKNGKKCRKKYCDTCLRRWYSTSVYDASEELARNWCCPACNQQCLCATCRRKPMSSDTYSENSNYTSNVLSPTTETGISTLSMSSPIQSSSTKQIQHKRKQYETTDESFVQPLPLQSQSRTVSLQHTNNISNSNINTLPDRSVSDTGGIYTNTDMNNSTQQYTQYNNNSSIQRYNTNTSYESNQSFSSARRATKTPRNSFVQPHMQRDVSYDKQALSPANTKNLTNGNALWEMKSVPVMNIVVPGSKKTSDNSNNSSMNSSTTQPVRRYSLSQSNQLYSNQLMNIQLPGALSLGERKQSIMYNNEKLLLTPLNMSLQSPLQHSINNTMLPYTPIDGSTYDSTILNKKSNLYMHRNSFVLSSPYINNSFNVNTPLNMSLTHFGLSTPADTNNVSSTSIPHNPQRRTSWSSAL